MNELAISLENIQMIHTATPSAIRERRLKHACWGFMLPPCTLEDGTVLPESLEVWIHNPQYGETDYYDDHYLPDGTLCRGEKERHVLHFYDAIGEYIEDEYRTGILAHESITL